MNLLQSTLLITICLLLLTLNGCDQFQTALTPSESKHAPVGFSGEVTPKYNIRTHQVNETLWQILYPADICDTRITANELAHATLFPNQPYDDWNTTRFNYIKENAKYGIIEIEFSTFNKNTLDAIADTIQTGLNSLTDKYCLPNQKGN